MTAFEFLAQQPIVHSVGWTLVHFVWQGLALAAFYAFVAHRMRSGSAQVRYLVGVATLLLMAAAPLVTVSVVHGAQSWIVTPVEATASTGWQWGPVVAGPEASGLAAMAANWMPWLVLAWIAGVLALAVRLFAGWWHIQALRRRGVHLAPAWVHAAVARLASELRVPVPVQVFLSTLIDAPTVIGWLRPVILLPASIVTGLSPYQLEMVIAHELGHVRRFDYLVNLVQVIISTLLFYHPAVAWVSKRIRTERENCCDDIVIEHTTDPIAYARALAALEAGRGDRVASLAMAATGGSLLDRIRRMFGQPESQHGRARVGWVAVLGTAMIVAVAVAVAVVGTNPWSTSADDVDEPTLVTTDVAVIDDAIDEAPLALAELRDASVADIDAASEPISDRGLNEDMHRAAAGIQLPAQLPKPEIRVAATLAPPTRAPQPVAPEPDDEEEDPAATLKPRAAANDPIEASTRSRSAMLTIGLVVRNLPDGIHTPGPEYPVGAVQTFHFNPNDEQVAARECAVTGSRLCRQRRA